MRRNIHADYTWRLWVIHAGYTLVRVGHPHVLYAWVVSVSASFAGSPGGAYELRCYIK